MLRSVEITEPGTDAWERAGWSPLIKAGFGARVHPRGLEKALSSPDDFLGQVGSC